MSPSALSLVIPTYRRERVLIDTVEALLPLLRPFAVDLDPETPRRSAVPRMHAPPNSRTSSVSVIIPTFNRAGLLPRAIDSCLSQRTDSLSVEVLVVDDGSTDDTLQRLAEYSDDIVVIALDKNCGRNRARNTGLARASGEFVMFLDSDDYLEPTALRSALALAIEQQADIVVAGYHDVALTSAGAEVRRTHDAPFMEPLVDRLLAGDAVPTSAALYRRSYLEGMWWDESLFKLDDWDWFIRACLRGGKVVRFPHPVYNWCEHEGQGIRSTSMLRNALEHHVILTKLEKALADANLLTEARRRRLAQYFYKELRVLCLHDRPSYRAAVQHILELDPHFRPKAEEAQRWMRWLSRLVGFERAVLLHTRLKRAYLALRGRPLAEGHP